MAFIEQGIAMLSSVLSSPIAIQVNIRIIRIFTNMREMLATHKEALARMEELESRMDEKIRVIFECMKELLRDAITDRPAIGFKQQKK